MDLYDQLAPFYDLAMAGFDADIGLYLGFARRLRGPVLELGCGSGRVAIELARAGISVVGLDRSPAMLALAREKLATEPDLPVTLLEADMRAFELGRHFALITLPLDGFLHLENQDDQLTCLRHIRDHLTRNGLLVLDLPSPASNPWEDWSPGVRPLVLAWSVALPRGARANKYSSFSADASTQTHLVTEIYERMDPTGSVRRWTVEYPLRYVFPVEIELLMRMAGLRVRARYGDYDLGPFAAESERQIVVAGAAPRRSRTSAR